MTINKLRAIVSPIIKLANSKFADKCIAIGNAIKAKEAVFKSVDPKADEGLEVFNALKTSIPVAENGSKAEKATMKELRTDSDVIIRGWAPQVTFDAKGSLSIIEDSKFPVSKSASPINTMAIPAVPAIKDSNKSGEVKGRVPKVYGAISYQYRYTTKDPATATHADYTELAPGPSRTIISGLTPGDNHFFSARAIGARNVSGWSAPKMFMPR